jgi:4-hydroxybenzoyl-CoA thioesterase
VLTPSIHFTADFVGPSRYGDTLTFRLWVARIGISSCELRVEASMLTQLRVKVRQVMVFIDAKTERASPISTELVEAMSAFVPPVVLTTSN